MEELLEQSPSAADEYSAILPVHLMGYPCDLEKLQKIADKHDLVVIEDSAQAHGTIYNGKKTGSIGIFGAFSLG